MSHDIFICLQVSQALRFLPRFAVGKTTLRSSAGAQLRMWRRTTSLAVLSVCAFGDAAIPTRVRRPSRKTDIPSCVDRYLREDQSAVPFSRNGLAYVWLRVGAGDCWLKTIYYTKGTDFSIRA